MPCLLFNGSGLVKTVQFKKPSYIGDPINSIKIFNEKEVDEIIFIDIMASKEKRKPMFEKLKDLTSEAFMPFTYGGGVSELEDFKTLFSIGVEKVAVNSLLFTNPNVVKKACELFGAQSVVGVMDVKKNFWKSPKVHNSIHGDSKRSIEEYLHYLQDEIGVGEILVQSVDLDGTWGGLDHDLIQQIARIAKIPIIALGGAKDTMDIEKALYESNAEAVAIGSMAVYQKKGMGVLINFPKRDQIIRE